MPHGPAGLVLPMRRVLAVTGAGLAAALPPGAAIGWLLAGRPGAWGALVGLLLPAAFFGVTAATALLTAGLPTARLGVVVAASWPIKIVVLLAVLSALRAADFYARPVFLVAFLVGVVGWLVAECVVVLRTRTPYVEPVAPATPDAP